jgi:hypothetical protein
MAPGRRCLPVAGYEGCSHFWDAQGTGQSFCTCTVPHAATAVVALVAATALVAAVEAALLGAVALVAAAMAARLVERASLCSRRSRCIPTGRSRRPLRPRLGRACSRRPARHKRLGNVGIRSLSSSGSPRSARFATVAGEARAETVEARADEAVDLAAKAAAAVTARAEGQRGVQAEDMVVAAVAAAGVVSAATHPPFD